MLAWGPQCWMGERALARCSRWTQFSSLHVESCLVTFFLIRRSEIYRHGGGRSPAAARLRKHSDAPAAAPLELAAEPELLATAWELEEGAGGGAEADAGDKKKKKHHKHKKYRKHKRREGVCLRARVGGRVSCCHVLPCTSLWRLKTVIGCWFLLHLLYILAHSKYKLS